MIPLLFKEIILEHLLQVYYKYVCLHAETSVAGCTPGSQRGLPLGRRLKGGVGKGGGRSGEIVYFFFFCILDFFFVMVSMY